MKFYLVVIQNDTAQAIYDYSTYSEALAVFHTELAYRGETREKTVCAILDSFGNLIKKEVWEVPVVPEEVE